MKTLELPNDIIELFDLAIAAQECRDECIARKFNYRKAVYFQNKFNKISRKAWGRVKKLYSEIDVEKDPWVYAQPEQQLQLKEEHHD